MTLYAPIALFVYNRPWHTRQTVEALKKNELASESDLIIFSDGPKNNAENFSYANEKQISNGIKLTNDERINQVREYIHTINGFKSVKIIQRDKNLGLANSIISGVTEVVNQYGKIIVLEDDLVTSPYFLKFMNDGLQIYESEPCVMAIHGYLPRFEIQLPETFFLRGADCWGWATWARAWKYMQTDGKLLYYELVRNKLLDRFDFGGRLNYSQMLKNQLKGKKDSWAVLWHASVLCQNAYSLHPGRSLVMNIGNDSSGSHKGITDVYDTKISEIPVIVNKIEISEEKWIYEEFRKFARKVRPNNTIRIIRKLSNYLKKYTKINHKVQ